MKLLMGPWASLRAGDDALAPFRSRVATELSALTAVLLLPFLLLHLVNANLLLASVTAFAQLVLTLNARALGRGLPPVVPMLLTTASFLLAVCLSIALQGLNGLLWPYPALFICYFLLPYKQALACSFVFTVAVSLLSYGMVGPEVALRVIATLTLTVIMINVVLGVIGDQQRALLVQTITDPLTGAFNRRHLQVRMDELATKARCVPTVNTLLAIDIDHFKSINDKHGHGVGDAVLQRMVQVLESRKRRSDVLFRTGGEEFCLLLPDTSQTEALRVAEELRRLIESAELLPGQHITVSIGVGQQPPGHAPEEWLRRADHALYEAKRSGRNRVVLAQA